jgi:flagellar assembly protein FliH
LSNLLKKDRESEVALFGYPPVEVEKADDPADEIETALPEVEEQPAEPEPDPEEVFRKKLLELERRTQEIEKEAYGKGFAQGEKDGLEYGQKSVQVVKTQLERIAAGMDALPAKIFQDYREWLIETSIRIAKQIVRRELQISPEILADMAKSLLSEVEENGVLTVYFNPQDLEFMEKRADLDFSSIGKLYVVKPDPGLERGGCKVESSVQLLDASIQSQFENLENYLLDSECHGRQDFRLTTLEDLGAAEEAVDEAADEIDGVSG